MTSTNANTVTLQTGTTSSSYSLVLPTAVGTTGQCLSTTVAGSTSTLGWSGCAPATGGAGYIQNATTTQTSANFNIQSTAVGSVTAVVKQLGSQTADLLQFQNSSATATIKINTDGNLLAGGVATATTGTTEATARTNVTAITLTTDAFSVNDVIFFNNAGQDYYTRVTVDNANGTYTVSPAVSYDASITVTKYTIQNIGATTTDYATQGNRFFQGYFTGGVVTGAGSTIYSDGVISAGPGLTIKNPSNSTTAFSIQNTSGTSLLNADTTNSTITITGVMDVSGSIATKKGTDYATTGTTNDVNFGDVSLVRLTGASTQTITGIANGRDGERLTIINAAGQMATISNNSGSSLAANRIITGTGADVSLVAGGSVELVYDSGASLWRIVGAVTSGGVPMAKAYNSANQSITNAAWNILSLNSEELDNNTMHDTVTNNSRMTIQTAGTYKIVGRVGYAGNATGVRYAGVFLNGTAGTGGTGTVIADSSLQAGPATSNTVVNVSGIRYFNAGDYIELEAYQSSGGALSTASAIGNTSFEVYRIDGGFTNSASGGITTVGALDGGTANATGATISGSSIFLQSASFTMPGLVNTTTQTFTGDKTIKSTTNSTSAFAIQNSAGTNVFNVATDTSTSSYTVTTQGNSNDVRSGGIRVGNANDGTLAGAIANFSSGTTNSASGYIGAFSNAYSTYGPYQDAFVISNNSDASRGIVIRDTNATGTIGFYLGNATTPHVKITNSAWYSGYTNTVSVGGTAGSASCGSVGCPVIALNTGGTSGSRWGVGVENGGSLAFLTENGSVATTRVTISNTATLTVAGTSACTIGSGTGATNCTSDARLKNLQGDATGNLAKIMQLQPEYYTWKSDTSQTLRMGLIAQNVQSVLPEFVVTGQDGYLQLDYGGLVAPIIGAIHEQQGQINSLTSSISALQSIDLTHGGVVNGNISISGNLAVSGTVSVTGAVSTGDIYVNGHIVTKGAAPVTTTGVALGILGASTFIPTVVSNGTDGAGTVTVTAGGEQLTSGILAHIAFSKAFTESYKVVASASNDNAAALRIYVIKTAIGFDIVSRDAVTAGTQYSFDYIVLGATNQ